MTSPEQPHAAITDRLLEGFQVAMRGADLFLDKQAAFIGESNPSPHGMCIFCSFMVTVCCLLEAQTREITPEYSLNAGLDDFHAVLIDRMFHFLEEKSGGETDTPPSGSEYEKEKKIAIEKMIAGRYPDYFKLFNEDIVAMASQDSQQFPRMAAKFGTDVLGFENADSIPKGLEAGSFIIELVVALRAHFEGMFAHAL